MKLKEKIPVRGDVVLYRWKVDDVKTKQACLDLALKASGVGKLDHIECKGYSDMDTWGNYCSFKSAADFKSGMKQVQQIDADTVTVFLKIGNAAVNVTVNPIWDNESGTYMNVMGVEDAVKKVSAALK